MLKGLNDHFAVWGGCLAQDLEAEVDKLWRVGDDWYGSCPLFVRGCKLVQWHAQLYSRDEVSSNLVKPSETLLLVKYVCLLGGQETTT